MIRWIKWIKVIQIFLFFLASGALIGVVFEPDEGFFWMMLGGVSMIVHRVVGVAWYYNALRRTSNIRVPEAISEAIAWAHGPFWRGKNAILHDLERALKERENNERCSSTKQKV